VLETHLRQNLRASGCAQTREYIDPFTWAQVSGVTFDHGDVFPLGIAARWDTQNEWGEWDVVLPAGDVSVTLIGEKNTDNGIATVRWDGVDRGTTDFYASSLSQNNRGTVSWTNSTTKKARLRITNATKNASSTGYDLAINRIVITYDNSGWTDPGHFAARTLVSVDDFNDNWRAQMQMRGEMPWVIDIDPLAPAIDNQGWSTYNKDDTFDYFVALSTDDSHLPGYDGFWVEWDVALAAGTYECSVIGSQGTTRGQMDVLLDGTAVVSNAEFYHASQTDSETRTTTGITVATTKVYRVRVRINSKNASASFFQGRLSRVRFRRTA
jgi:hypothetical protein